MRYTLKSPVDVYLSLCCEEDYPRNAEAAKRWHVARNRSETWIMDENGDTVASVEREDAANLIAAAPDLLAACETAVARLTEFRDCAGPCDHEVGICNCDISRAISMLKRAIKAAKGGE